MARPKLRLVKSEFQEPLKPEDVAAVSKDLLPPTPPEEEKLAYHPENTVLTEDVAMAKSTASGAGTSGGVGSFQPFLSRKELEKRENPESWEDESVPDSDAPQR